MDFVVPLISAAIAGLIAWIVARHQGRTARENWVLDKRYVLYERVLKRAAPLTTAGSWDAAVDTATDRVFRAQLTEALVALELVAPGDIRVQAQAVTLGVARAGAGTRDAAGKVLDELRTLLAQLQEDLVPKHMR